jgi:RNA polymerase sporulation-specific sigma factor
MPHACATDQFVSEESMLIRSAREGNDGALLALFARYEFFTRMLSSSAHFSGLETEDLVQEGFIGLFFAVRDYRAERGASFHTYVLLCIKRRMLSALRTASCQKHIPLNNYLSLDDEINAQAAALTNVVNPEDMIVCRENIDAMRNVVEKCLTASEREILNMYLLGYSYAAISKSMDVSIKFIDNSLQRIRRKLVVSLKD